MIRLTSKWTLKNGLTTELMHNLESAAELIQTKESSTLMYLVHLDKTLSSNHSTEAVDPNSDGTETAITFIEIYKNAAEYRQQNMGQVFASFRKENLKFFVEDPENPGWPAVDSQMIKLDSGLVQQNPSELQQNQMESGIQI